MMPSEPPENMRGPSSLELEVGLGLGLMILTDGGRDGHLLSMDLSPLSETVYIAVTGPLWAATLFVDARSFHRIKRPAEQ